MTEINVKDGKNGSKRNRKEKKIKDMRKKA